MQHLSAQRDARVEVRYQVARSAPSPTPTLPGRAPKLRPALAEASRALDVALQFLADRGAPDAAAAARRIEARHAPSLQLVRQILGVVDRGDTEIANQIHARRIHPAYLDLQAQTAALAAREQAEATASLTGLRDRQHALLPAAFVAAGVGCWRSAASCCWPSATSGRSSGRPPPATTRRCTTRSPACRTGSCSPTASARRPAAPTGAAAGGAAAGPRPVRGRQRHPRPPPRRPAARRGRHPADRYCTPSPRPTCAPVGSSAWRRWCAASTPTMVCSGRASSPRWVLDAALRQAGAWRRTSHELSVAVNVSTRSLLDRDFSDQVADRLAARGSPAA